MPNWCENIIIVEGDEKRIDEFIKYAENRVDGEDLDKHQAIDFDKFVPYPSENKEKDRLKELRQRIRECKNDEELTKVREEHKITNDTYKEIMLLSLENEDDEVDWYHWRISHWGTKWNARFYGDENDVVRLSKNAVKYRFDTAWSPPLPVIAGMSKMFGDLIFTLLYGEGGNAFSGWVRIKDYKVLEEAHYNTYKNNWYQPKTMLKKWKLDKIY